MSHNPNLVKKSAPIFPLLRSVSPYIFLQTPYDVNVVMPACSLPLQNKLIMHKPVKWKERGEKEEAERTNEYALHVWADLSFISAHAYHEFFHWDASCFISGFYTITHLVSRDYLQKKIWVSFKCLHKVMACADKIFLLLLNQQAGYK